MQIWLPSRLVGEAIELICSPRGVSYVIFSSNKAYRLHQHNFGILRTRDWPFSQIVKPAKSISSWATWNLIARTPVPYFRGICKLVESQSDLRVATAFWSTAFSWVAKDQGHQQLLNLCWRKMQTTQGLWKCLRPKITAQRGWGKGSRHGVRRNAQKMNSGSYSFHKV